MNGKFSLSSIVVLALMVFYFFSELPGAAEIRRNFFERVANDTVTRDSPSNGTLQASRETTPPDSEVQSETSEERFERGKSPSRFCASADKVPAREEPIIGVLQEESLRKAGAGATITFRISEYCLIRFYEVQQVDGEPVLKVVRQITLSGAVLPPRGLYQRLQDAEGIVFSASSGREKDAFVIQFFPEGTAAPLPPAGTGTKGVLEVPVSTEDLERLQPLNSLSITS